MNDSNAKTNLRLLVIDDNHAIHKDFRKVLSPEQASANGLDAAEKALFGETSEATNQRPHFQIDSAFQGKEGFELVSEALKKGQRYAMAFIDMRMPPGWDGIETTLKIWSVEPDIQIVICTAYSDYSWEEMQNQLGQSDQLVILKKPFDNIEVIQLACSLTRKWQLLQESKRKLTNLEELVMAKTAQMVSEQEKFKSIFDNSPEGIFQTDPAGHLMCANSALANIYGYSSTTELMDGLTNHEQELYVEPERRAEWKRRIHAEKIVSGFESEIRCPNGSRKWISETACKVTKLDGSLLYYQGFVVDITAQKIAQQESHLMEAQLRQAQKLESVGQLAAGIAHEINTPIQYIGDNIRFVEESFAGLTRLLSDYQKLASAVRENSVTPEMLAGLDQTSKSLDLGYLMEEIPTAVHQSLDGVKHVAHIVGAMKEFSHPGKKEKICVDLNHAIDTTITVARNEWKYVAEMVTDFGDMPPVSCLVAEFNQVILNLVVNAAHAIADVTGRAENVKGTIKITTRVEGSFAKIDVSDTGAGIPMEVQRRIFEPFFTTKPVGKGTGQGLAIARTTIVKKHGGELSFVSAPGKGTTFTIRLPLNTPDQDKAMAE